jgi:hypothetical protein
LFYPLRRPCTQNKRKHASIGTEGCDPGTSQVHIFTARMPLLSLFIDSLPMSSVPRAPSRSVSCTSQYSRRSSLCCQVRRTRSNPESQLKSNLWTAQETRRFDLMTSTHVRCDTRLDGPTCEDVLSGRVVRWPVRRFASSFPIGRIGVILAILTLVVIGIVFIVDHGTSFKQPQGLSVCLSRTLLTLEFHVHLCFLHRLEFESSDAGLCKIPALYDFLISRFPDFQISRFPDFQISRFPYFQISRFPDFQISRFPDFQISSFQDYRFPHQITYYRLGYRLLTSTYRLQITAGCRLHTAYYRPQITVC